MHIIDKHTSCGYVITEATTLDPDEHIATCVGLSLSTVVLSGKKGVHSQVLHDG
jgi:hypothetical protein